MKSFIFSEKRVLAGIMVLLTISLITNSCSKSNSSATPGANEVLIQNMAFDPATITVTAGTTITWTNKDGVAHTVTSNTGAFDSGTLNTNGVYTHMFPTAGSFPYHCTVHPSMTATVIVN